MCLEILILQAWMYCNQAASTIMSKPKRNVVDVCQVNRLEHREHSTNRTVFQQTTTNNFKAWHDSI